MQVNFYLHISWCRPVPHCVQGEFDAGYMYKCKFTEEEEKAKLHPDVVDEPIQAVPVAESNDVPISTLRFR